MLIFEDVVISFKVIEFTVVEDLEIDNVEFFFVLLCFPEFNLSSNIDNAYGDRAGGHNPLSKSSPIS
jgi:hypothetical protein